MAIDEIEGETCDITNTIPSITISPDCNQLDKGAKSVKISAAVGNNDINYIDEDDDDDVIILESNSSANNILVILDDDPEQEPANNVCKSTDNSDTTNEFSRKTISPKTCDLNQPQQGILEKDFDKFCLNFLPPLRQYGRKQKKILPTPEEDNNIFPSSSRKEFHQIGDVCETNYEKDDLSRHQIQNEEERDGLKDLSEISSIFCNASSPITNELEEDVTPVQDEISDQMNDDDDDNDCIVQSDLEEEQEILEIIDEEYDETDLNRNNDLKTSFESILVCTYPKIENETDQIDKPTNSKSCFVKTKFYDLSSKGVQYKNSSREEIQRIQPSWETAHAEEDSQSSEGKRPEDIQFYLKKIFEANNLNDSDTQPSPIIVTMKDNPIIISEDGVVTVIYKPEKIKFRREIEISEPVPRKRPFHGNEARQTKAFKRKEKCSSDEILDMHRPNEQTQPNKEIIDVQNKIYNGHLRLSDIKKRQRAGIRWTKKKYPPLCKINYMGEMVYKCNDCDFFHRDNVASVNRHMIRHQPAESIDWFHCDLCSYRAKRKGNLKIHMILHRNPDDVVWFKCAMCDKKFKHRNGLYSHEKRHIKREELELYLCNQCSYKTPSKHTLLRHKFNHESIEKKKLLLCHVCHYSTYNKYYLSRHKKHTHREPMFKCLLCNYEAKYKANLEKNQVERPLQTTIGIPSSSVTCLNENSLGVCSQTQYQRDSFGGQSVGHLKTHFPIEEMFYCDSCNFSTHRRYTLTLHNRNVHNFYSSPENQMFVCYNCHYQTRFKRCLVKHMAIHSGTQGSQDVPVKIKTEVKTD